jgi:hypothetical protein
MIAKYLNSLKLLEFFFLNVTQEEEELSLIMSIFILSNRKKKLALIY